MNVPVLTPVINWRNKINKKGCYPTHLRVYIHPDPYRYYPIPVPQKVRLDQWTGIDGGWVKNSHLFAFEINNRIKNHLADQKGRKGKLEGSTIKSYFNKLKIVLEHAAKKEHLLDPRAVEEYFHEITITESKRKEGLHLEIEEVQALRRLTFKSTEFGLERDRDLFLFEVYTGFYYNDLQILKKKQLFKDIEHGYYIIGERDKNGNPNIIPLFKFPYAQTIIEKYRDTNPANELLFRKEAFIEIQNFNGNLKILGKRANIIRPISNKTRRHTNAQMWIRFGADRPVLSK